MLGKFNSFIEKWMAFVTPVCLLTGVFFSDYCEAWCTVCYLCFCVYDVCRRTEVQIQGCGRCI